MFQSIVDYFHTTPNYMLGYDSQMALDVTGLSEKEVLHIMSFVDDLKELHRKNNE